MLIADVYSSMIINSEHYAALLSIESGTHMAVMIYEYATGIVLTSVKATIRWHFPSSEIVMHRFR